MTHDTRMARQALGRWLLGLLVSLVFSSLPGGAAFARGSPPEDIPGQLTLQDERLTASLAGALLRQVMAEVSRLSGVQVRWMDATVKEQAVSVEFRDLPLAEAVRRMLRAHNVLLVYTSSGEGTRLTQIWIASREDAPRGREQPPAPHMPPPPTAAEPLAAMEEPVVAMEESAAAVEPPLEALMETATGEADMAARLSAIGALGNHALDDARVRELLEDLADHDDNPQVRDAASMLLGGGR